jgi:hypothetical protein
VLVVFLVAVLAVVVVWVVPRVVSLVVSAVLSLGLVGASPVLDAPVAEQSVPAPSVSPVIAYSGATAALPLSAVRIGTNP